MTNREKYIKRLDFVKRRLPKLIQSDYPDLVFRLYKTLMPTDKDQKLFHMSMSGCFLRSEKLAIPTGEYPFRHLIKIPIDNGSGNVTVMGCGVCPFYKCSGLRPPDSICQLAFCYSMRGEEIVKQTSSPEARAPIVLKLIELNAIVESYLCLQEPEENYLYQTGKV